MLIRKVKNTELFDYVPLLLQELFCKNEYPWEVIKMIGGYISCLVERGIEGYNRIENNILVGENVKIYPTATVEGPAVICSGSEIRPGAFIRGNIFVGENCVVGNSTELKNSLLLSRVQVPHYNYVGDSVLGNGAHLGAGAICSNLKADGKNVVVHGDTEYETGMRKLGAMLGDNADIGCGCVLNPGTVVGKNTSVYPLVSVRGVIPEKTIVKREENIVKKL